VSRWILFYRIDLEVRHGRKINGRVRIIGLEGARHQQTQQSETRNLHIRMEPESAGQVKHECDNLESEGVIGTGAKNRD
jgi:hypothetical protein